MKVLDLFSGIGGFSLGLERAGMQTVQFVENDPYCQKVLAKNFPDVPIHGDIKTFHYDKPVQLISGGFPCQPYSQAGKQRGKEDDRHLWGEYLRIIQEVRPGWIIGENVSGIVNMELDQVLSDLESENYSHQSLVIPACAVNAPHRRDRVWIIAKSKSKGRECRETRKQGFDSQCEEKISGRRGSRNVGNSECNGLSTAKESGSSSSVSNNSPQGENKTFQSTGTSGRRNNENVAHAKRKRQSGSRELERSCNTEKNSTGETSWLNYGGEGWKRNWDFEPELGRVANGIPNRMDRLKGLGNAVVPQIVEIIGRAIMEIEENKSQ